MDPDERRKVFGVDDGSGEVKLFGASESTDEKRNPTFVRARRKMPKLEIGKSEFDFQRKEPRVPPRDWPRARQCETGVASGKT